MEYPIPYGHPPLLPTNPASWPDNKPVRMVAEQADSKRPLMPPRIA